jgi:hypothetical protein
MSLFLLFLGKIFQQLNLELYRQKLLKRTVSRDFLLQVFFHESPSPKPLIITLGSFRNFSKIRGDIRKSRCTTDTGGKFATGVNETGGKLPLVSTTPAANLPPVSTTPAANFATSFPCVVDTGGKFATGVNNTGGKFASGVNDAGGKLPPVSTTPAANLPPVSLTPVANNGNNIRLLTPESELEGKNLYICFLY